MSLTPWASRYLGIGSIPYSGMPGPPSGPAPRSTSTESGGHAERRVVDPLLHLRVAVEDHRGPGVREQRPASAASGLMTAPSGARLPRSTARPPSADSALSGVRITSGFADLGLGQVLAEGPAVRR